ncbi:ABC transporter ATPase [Flavobacteriaceae bacterium AH-315-O20]|nr:ABC transporter ATPase [Flavobacteriaceae bacterium AH-315-O20]
MLYDFEDLADDSKIWVYQSNREFKAQEVEEIKLILERFIATWKRHGDDLKASYEIRYNQFIIIAVDETYNGVSGCSIDASTHIFKQIENTYKVELFNKLQTAFKYGENINIVSLAEFQKYAKEQKIDRHTIVFNNMIQTKKELETNWEVIANKSWHSRYF